MATIDLYEAMRTLRAVRRLRPDPIPDDVLYRVLEAASWAPTGGNRQAWRIIVVKDAARKQRLGELYKKNHHPLHPVLCETVCRPARGGTGQG